MALKYYASIILKKICFNVVTNNILVFFKLDKWVVKKLHPYISFKPLKGKSLQEIAGFSHRPEIDEVLLKSHKDLKNVVNKYCQKNAKVLDIGCGPGLYLKDFDHSFSLYGLDISEEMLKIATKELPNIQFIKSNFIQATIPNGFNLIYSIGVLIYIPPSDIEAFFKKAYEHLEKGGILYLNYPHAISFLDLLYPDLSYVQYSPNKIKRLASKYFDIISHHHAFDERIVGAYDKTPYKSLNPITTRTYRNSYLLIAQKK